MIIPNNNICTLKLETQRGCVRVVCDYKIRVILVCMRRGIGICGISMPGGIKGGFDSWIEAAKLWMLESGIWVGWKDEVPQREDGGEGRKTRGVQDRSCSWWMQTSDISAP